MYFIYLQSSSPTGAFRFQEGEDVRHPVHRITRTAQKQRQESGAETGVTEHQFPDVTTNSPWASFNRDHLPAGA